MEQHIKSLSFEDEDRIASHRHWVINHFEDPKLYDSVSGKLRVIQTILDNGWVDEHETWKLQSLGISFGDALAEELTELSWVAVEDEYGRDPALRWRETEILLFPLTAISNGSKTVKR